MRLAGVPAKLRHAGVGRPRRCRRGILRGTAPISVAIVHQYPASVSDWEPSVVAEDVAIEETVGNCGPTNTRCGGFEGTFCPARTHSSGRIAAAGGALSLASSLAKSGLDRHRGGGHPPTPATPPCVRVRTRRFELVITAAETGIARSVRPGPANTGSKHGAANFSPRLRPCRLHSASAAGAPGFAEQKDHL